MSDSTWPNIEVEFDRPIELYIDSFQGFKPESKAFKVLWVKEAEVISNIASDVIKNKDVFDAIITFDEHILQECSNAYFMPFGTAWVHDYDNSTEKKFQISNLTGFKTITDGHKLRKKAHYKQNRITNPIDFYVSKHGGVDLFEGNKVLGETKTEMFKSMFHICIENSKQKNYFTEKIMDCFVTNTIPIYWGCPNIDEFFDINGIIVVNNLDEIISICNIITEKTYLEKHEYIQKNFEISKKYITIVDRFEEELKKILKKTNG